MSDGAPVNDGKGEIDCEEALRHLAEYLDGELADREDTAVRSHLDTCRSCWSRAEFERRLRTRLTDLRAGDVPEDFERRMLKLIQNFGTAS